MMLKTPLATRLCHKPGVTNNYVMRQGFEHVIHGERGNTRTGQRFHLDTGLMAYFAATIDNGLVADDLDRYSAAI